MCSACLHLILLKWRIFVFHELLFFSPPHYCKVWKVGQAKECHLHTMPPYQKVTNWTRSKIVFCRGFCIYAKIHIKQNLHHILWLWCWDIFFRCMPGSICKSDEEDSFSIVVRERDMENEDIQSTSFWKRTTRA